MRRALLFLAVIGLSAAASAQLRLPTIIPRAPPPPALVGIDALRAEFIARSGSSIVYFGGDSSVLGAPARQTLALQAAWLRQHPEVVVRIEGHAMAGDTRDHALAIGARRAEAVRDLLVLLGVPAAQLSAVSIGKERPVGLNARAVTVLVR